ncbi:transcription factor Sp2 [Fopius arisanus]|uniref:Transcription factor Sp2 n=2 Tax=Fopius arisanus TaxID=64838 RepID=A0A9R1SXN7_9HYME|nr:PREDICTED: transcription factor Sp2-like [Fopius arisanus]
MNDQSVHSMQQQQQHMNQQIHLQQMQKHNVQHQHNSQDTSQQQITNYNNHHGNDNFVHHMQNQNSGQGALHSQMHQFHQHSMQHQQNNQHIMQNQTHDQFHMQLQHQQQQYNNSGMSHHDIVQSNGSIMTGINSGESQIRHNRTPSIGEEDISAKQMSQQISQQQLLMHNHGMQRHHMQNGNLQNIAHDNMQRMYGQHQVQFPRSCDQSKGTNMEIKGHQQYMLVSQAGRSPTSGNVIEVQSPMGTNVPSGQSSNVHFNQRAQMWPQNRTIQPSHQSPPVSVQNITCNSMDRVPPLHHHIPPTPTWTDEVARKKAKSSKSLTKKQRHHMAEIRNNNVEQSSLSPRDDFDKSQSNNQIGSTVSNSPSFLEDPSGYLAQQTALLNSTISRQTGVSSSQMMMSTPKLPQGSHSTNPSSYLPQQKPSSATSPTSSSVNSVKNHATSPVVVHSSMTPTSVGSNTSDSDTNSCQGCVTSGDTQYVTEQFKQQMHRQYMLHTDPDPVTSSTFNERFTTNQQMDSRPIQGGTISTSHGSPIGTNSPANSDTPSSSATGISQPATPQSLISSQPSTPHSYSQPPTPHSNQVPSQSLTPVSQPPSQSSANPSQEQPQSITSASSTLSPSTSPQRGIPPENGSPPLSKKSTPRQQTPEGYQPHPHTITSVRLPMIPFSNSTVITTMASGHTFSSNTITSVLAGKANTATVSINTPSGIPNSAIPNILSTKPIHQPTTSTSIVTSALVHSTNSIPINHGHSHSTIISKSPLEMVQSVVSSIQVPQASANSIVPHHQTQQHQQQQQQQQVNPQNQQTVQNVPHNGPSRQSTGQQTVKEGSRSKPQPCKVCGKVLSSASSYYVHMKLHSGNKPYHCTVCEASFCRKPYLEVHMRTHTGERPFQCELCLKRFTQKSSLNTHKRVHTGERPYACDICQKRFAVKSYVTAHRWSHVAEKPLVCDRCSLTFTSKSQFAIHIRTHTASTTYECNICGRTFVRDSYLIRHQNRVHRDMNQSNSNHNPSTPQSTGGQTPGTGFESPVCDLRYNEGPSSLDGLGGGKGGIAVEIASLGKQNSLQLPVPLLHPQTTN